MSIEHIVLFKRDPAISSEKIARAFTACRELLAEMNVVDGFSLGAIFENVLFDSGEVGPSPSSDFTHVLTLRFRDRASLDAYFAHPNHKKIAVLLQPPFPTALMLDYEDK